MSHENLAKKLGQRAGIAAFIVVMALSLVHEGFGGWLESWDEAIFGLTHPRYHPSLAIAAAIVALAAAASGYMIGRHLDRR